MTLSIRKLQQGVEVMFRKVCVYLVKYCTLYRFRHILQVTNWTRISEVINSSFFVARINKGLLPCIPSESVPQVAIN